jgi:hypothetical protein
MRSTITSQRISLSLFISLANIIEVSRCGCLDTAATRALFEHSFGCFLAALVKLSYKGVIETMSLLDEDHTKQRSSLLLLLPFEVDVDEDVSSLLASNINVINLEE